MPSLKLLFIACLIFDFSLWVNEANELKNSFEPNKLQMNCLNSAGTLVIKGAWNNSEIIPESLSFTLKLKDGNNFECTFTNETQTDITCAIKNVKFKVEYTDTYMDANNEYLLEGLTYDKDFVCLSSYIYSNLILLFIIIFILFI